MPASRPSANRKILAIAVPVALSSQVDTLVGMADIFIVSRLREASATAKQAFTLVAMITGSLSIVGWFGAHLCLEAMSLAPAVVELGTAYLRIYFAGMVVLSLNYAVSTCFYGMGDARTPLYVNIAASLIKVGATYVLVLGPFGLSAWLCALPVVLLARPFMELFTDVPEVIGIGVIYLWAVALAEPFMCLGITTGGAMRGAGDTKPALYYTIVAQWIVRLPLGYLLAFSLGLQERGLWIALVLLSVVQGLLTWRKFRQGQWLLREI